IDRVVDTLINDSAAHMATAVTALKTEKDALNPSIVKCVMDQNQYALYFSRSLVPANKKLIYNPQHPYYGHLGLYAFRPDFLLHYAQMAPTPLQLAEDLEQLKILENGGRIKVTLVDHMSFGVDTPDDIHKVEQWLCKQNSFLYQEASVPPSVKV